MKNIKCIDLFCGAGGLTHGFELEGIDVIAGIDLDPACRYPYEANNGAKFIQQDVSTISKNDLLQLYGNARFTVLAGCAPCQPFSTYSQRYGVNKGDGKWGLLYEFARLAKSTTPDFITMENVPTVVKHAVFKDFVKTLNTLGYYVWSDVVDSSKYGVPQTRRRMVLLASKHGPIVMVPPTSKKPRTVKQAIGRLRALEAGEASSGDRLHVSATLSPINYERILYSLPGGTWRDWPQRLVNKCHKAVTGKTFPGVYGRMAWDKPAPTMTTQCYGFGNGRFGHPDQNRAITLREAAILQSFPKNYSFMHKDSAVNFTALGRMIGNAVPVDLGRAIAQSIKQNILDLKLL